MYIMLKIKMLIFTFFAGDPTLPRSDAHPCPKCHHREAVFFQSDSSKAQDEMKLYYVCTNVHCSHRWTE